MKKSSNDMASAAERTRSGAAHTVGGAEESARNLAAVPERAATLEALQRQLTAWRSETADPLLSSDNLRRLTEEVRAITSKDTGKSLQWGYPDYFFGREPAAATPTPTAKKKKKKGGKSKAGNYPSSI